MSSSKPPPELYAPGAEELSQDRAVSSALASIHTSLVGRRGAKTEVSNAAVTRQMTLFPEELRAISSDLARSPLFAPIRPGPRRIWNEQLPSPDGVTIHYCGEQLDQADCDVFMQLIHEARGKTIGPASPIEFNRANLLHGIGRTDGGSSYDWLADSLSRMRDGKLTLENRRYRIETSLILKIVTDKEEGLFQVLFDTDIVKMFSGTEYTLVEWSKRNALRRRVDLSKWLLNFTCSHERGVQRWQVENLLQWSGYQSPARKFRTALAEALTELTRVGLVCEVEFYEKGKKVKWTRP